MFLYFIHYSIYCKYISEQDQEIFYPFSAYSSGRDTFLRNKGKYNFHY